jgi:hypothetical protein
MRQALRIVPASILVSAALLIGSDFLFRASLHVARDGRIARAQFVGLDQGGPTWVGHDVEVMAASITLLVPLGRP